MKTKEKEYYLRKCDGCNKGMSRGIYLFNEYYFCDKDCLNKNYKRLDITFNLEINPIEDTVTFKEFLNWINEDNNYELYQVYNYYNGIAEWYIGDDWGYLFDIEGNELDTEEVQEKNIVEGK